MNSLRSRQLISSFAILMASIFVLGTLLYMFTQSGQLKSEKRHLQEPGFDLLGFISYDNGKFVVRPKSKEELKLFLERQNLTSDLTDSLAYIQNTSTSIIHWHSIEPFEDLSSRPMLKPIVDYLPTFPVKVPPGTKTIGMWTPETKRQNSHDPDPFIHAEKYITYAYGFQHDKRGDYQLVIARTATHLISNQRKMVEHLIYLFIISALLVLLLQLATSYWVIAPIKDFDDEIKRIEAGEHESIVNKYPEELEPVKNTINALLQFEKGQKRRFRDSLDDLAHSLKTPLAAMNGLLGQGDTQQHNDENTQEMSSQLNRMKEIISYQLRKAIVSSNQNTLAPPIRLRPVLTRLRDSLYKVHHEKEFVININVEDNLVTKMDEDDLMELLGNLMNNACRFCIDTVDVTARQDAEMVQLDIDDDGMGFSDANPSRLLQRGIRDDSKTEGQGIGLAVSTEIVSSVGGTIELLVSPQVGARVRLNLPS